VELKDFNKIYEKEGIYQMKFRHYRRWWRERNWRMLAECVEEGDIVLDLASGPGVLGDYIIAKGGHPTGIDASARAVELSDAFAEKVCWGEMTKIPFRNNAFTLVLCSLSLHYLLPDELCLCLDEVKRVLWGKGRFAFSYPNMALKPPTSDAMELEWEILETILRKSGFVVDSRKGISPFFPGWLIKLAQSPYFWLLKPYLEWRAERVLHRPDESYHYIVETHV